MRFFFHQALLLGVAVCLVSGPLTAQDGSSAPTTTARPAPDEKPSASSDDAAPKSNVQPAVKPSNQSPGQQEEPPKRMFGMIPDFENTNDTAANRRPLTIREKYVLSLHQAFDISAHIGDAFQAALEQAGNGQPHYGQGWGAYGERFAANEGDQITSSILIYGVLPSILHEDPRYFRQGRGSAMARFWYAINRTFVTRKDRGTVGFNTSETVGQLMSAGISVSYYPPQDRSVGHVFSNWAVNLGGNSGYNVLSEYYPDIMRNIFHRHDKPPAQLQTGTR
jgi:hypothetical protein